ncbi:MAG: UDP-N-acetylmuramoyl-L-alanyl-D-glutamate--2,6-diaminopimelate ligase, partial [Bacteroidales bacterium]|nr:UDP-N-acetylmuramoyl-L-alanyl-D-glutamate--2,6-diaminopimelate ligase [Bacteroidales bacterium]
MAGTELSFALSALVPEAAGTDVRVRQLCFDSRRVEPESVFFAVKGSGVDGHAFIPQAVAAGARAVVCEQLPAERQAGVCYVQVPDSAAALGQAASVYYGRPSEKLVLVG